jgi:hypothetical protein
LCRVDSKVKHVAQVAAGLQITWLAHVVGTWSRVLDSRGWLQGLMERCGHVQFARMVPPAAASKVTLRACMHMCACCSTKCTCTCVPTCMPNTCDKNLQQTAQQHLCVNWQTWGLGCIVKVQHHHSMAVYTQSCPKPCKWHPYALLCCCTQTFHPVHDACLRHTPHTKKIRDKRSLWTQLPRWISKTCHLAQPPTHNTSCCMPQQPNMSCNMLNPCPKCAHEV